ncbi:P-loop containing nucleoside triphosphate hydrolase protein [Annulohypoxylon maeteangense]|uniref:P-loop containing nucleoside triphosphate hydrolase protein n=1 Tax=Annulohypoxylon maeteangense TaxID=1927788 RepID=UPI00200792EA|nr:P-loop containing nucleoside triphosphate hydrolase protein [Annulohypoxylon maeteangense]KAI0889382.1 P-loop containing nucleoside triphosphate hydrolase protein [Annulohypoxylon maeteangense]
MYINTTPHAIARLGTRNLRFLLSFSVTTTFRHRWCGIIQYQGVRCLATQILPETKGSFIPSAEQQAIVELSRLQNVVVSARPGAGKTATAEAIVRANPGLAVAVVTYSKRLQLETARRLEGYGMCDVYTFHGMAGKLFKEVVFNDVKLRDLRSKGRAPVWTGRPYDIIILDELQDCTESLYWLASTFILAVTHASGGRAPRIVALGDEKQAIYDFRGADPRFLNLSPSILSDLSPYKWTHLPLSKSFRLSHETARFVNEVFLGGGNHITGSHDGPKPIYMHENLLYVRRVAEKLVPLIEKYGVERTAILAPSLRANAPLASLTNYLSEDYGMPVAVSVSDEVQLNDDVIDNKVCASTYHQFKGNERDLVIVYGADNAYFKFIGRDLPDDRCPNATYVAITRARKQLVILHDHGNTPMPFIHLPKLKRTATIISSGEMKPQPQPGRPLQLGLLLPKNVWVSDMARHVREELLQSIVNSHVDIAYISPRLPESQHIHAPDKVLTDPAKMMYEAVSDLNGIAVVAAYEYALRRKLTGLGYKKKKTVEINNDEAAWFCEAACKSDAEITGYHSRLVQMEGHKFDWLNTYLDAAVRRLGEQFEGAGAAESLEFESRMRDNKFVVPDRAGKTQHTKLLGRADIVMYEANSKVTDAAIWEIKFVARLSLEHVVQACAYAYLWALKRGLPELPRVVLFNLRDGERWEITSPSGTAGVKKLLQDVLRAKFSTEKKVSTEEFLRNCRRVRDEVAGMW